jgi:hypothetical protein
MFDFGDPVDTARISWDSALRVKGPKVPLVPYDEMTEPDLRNMLAYLHISIEEGLEADVSGAVMEILVAEYDQAFQVLAEGSDDFRDSVEAGRHFPATGVTPESVQKYRDLAGL